ncbi:MAG: ABC transporter permease [Acidimicrobiia bacterium]
MDNDRTLVGRERLGPLATLALFAVPTLFLGYFFVYPLVSITVRGLTIDGSFSLGVIWDVMSNPGLQGVAAFTLWQAILSTLLTLTLGLPLAWVFARFTFPGKRALSAATLVPFVLPTLVVGTAFLNLAGPRGILPFDLTGSLAIILIAHSFYNVALVVRGVGAYWERIDPRIEDAARTLGASPWRTMRSVTLPLLAPSILSTSALVFLFSFTSFGVVLLLGDLSHTTIEVEIWRQATAYFRLDIASTLAVLQIVGIGVVLMIHGRFERRTRVTFRHRIAPPHRPRGARQRFAVYSILTVGCLYVGVPLSVLIVRSLSQPSGGFGLENYQNLVSLPQLSAAFVNPIDAIINSLWFALIAVLLAVTIGALASSAIAYSKRRVSSGFDNFIMLPLATSAVTIGFGFLVALHWPIDIRSSLILIPIAHALVGIPFVVRSINPTMGTIQNELREAAATLGADAFRTWTTIDARLIGRAALVGAAFAFAISMGEFGATTFIARPATPTIPIAIFRYLGRPGAAPFGAALALSVVLMVVVAIATMVIDWVGQRRAPSA